MVTRNKRVPRASDAHMEDDAKGDHSKRAPQSLAGGGPSARFPTTSCVVPVAASWRERGGYGTQPPPPTSSPWQREDRICPLGLEGWKALARCIAKTGCVDDSKSRALSPTNANGGLDEPSTSSSVSLGGRPAEAQAADVCGGGGSMPHMVAFTMTTPCLQCVGPGGHARGRRTAAAHCSSRWGDFGVSYFPSSVHSTSPPPIVRQQVSKDNTNKARRGGDTAWPALLVSHQKREKAGGAHSGTHKSNGAQREPRKRRETTALCVDVCVCGAAGSKDGRGGGGARARAAAHVRGTGDVEK